VRNTWYQWKDDPVTSSYDCSDPVQRSEGLAAAQRAVSLKQCIVLPTDTVYGIGADAFSPQAVATLLASKGRGRNMPPPVLVPRIQTLDGLATDVHPDARRLAEEFWPGGLTLICHAQPSLTWDLGDTLGTVALRMPDDDVALELLTLTGPLAVSSANRTRRPAATSVGEAAEQLAESVAVYLDAGPRDAAAGLGSTIVDATGETLRIVRQGTISEERLRGVVPGILGVDAPSEESTSEESASGQNPTDQQTD
jgi:L-threonylcarbamoyladenylate synthase